MIIQRKIDPRTHNLEWFDIRELVPPQIFRMWGAKSIMFLSYRICWTADAIREYFGKRVTVNSYKWGGPFSERGFRMPDSTTGAGLSAHKRGNALDFEIDGIHALEVQKEIVSHPDDPAFRFVTRVERDRLTWTHVDCVQTDCDGILYFDP